MRRRGRVCALQILYQLDMGHDLEERSPTGSEVDDAMRRYWLSFEQVGEADREFAERLVRGVARLHRSLDEAISGVSHNWKVPRMDKVDRNVLRVATYEITCCPDVPPAASINEAIEIAKQFSGKEAASFINGILDQIASNESTGVPDDLAGEVE